MRIMAFDLSSVCIGVVTADVNDVGVDKILSCPIIPEQFDPSTLGYMKSKKRLPLRNGELINTYWIKGEETITKQLKKKRDQEVRHAKDMYVIDSISKSISVLIEGINPELIIVERNEIFNGILTTVLLAKVMGSLLGIAGANGIPVKEYNVNVARGALDTKNILADFTRSKSSEDLKKIPDVTKRALGEEMSRIYGIEFKTDDESDACVVFHYWYTKHYLEGDV